VGGETKDEENKNADEVRVGQKKKRESAKKEEEGV
jgi:hypothetical protein